MAGHGNAEARAELLRQRAAQAHDMGSREQQNEYERTLAARPHTFRGSEPSSCELCGAPLGDGRHGWDVG